MSPFKAAGEDLLNYRGGLGAQYESLAFEMQQSCESFQGLHAKLHVMQRHVTESLHEPLVKCTCLAKDIVEKTTEYRDVLKECKTGLQSASNVLHGFIENTDVKEFNTRFSQSIGVLDNIYKLVEYHKLESLLEESGQRLAGVRDRSADFLTSIPTQSAMRCFDDFLKTLERSGEVIKKKVDDAAELSKHFAGLAKTSLETDMIDFLRLFNESRNFLEEVGKLSQKHSLEPLLDTSTQQLSELSERLEAFKKTIPADMGRFTDEIKKSLEQQTGRMSKEEGECTNRVLQSLEGDAKRARDRLDALHVLFSIVGNSTGPLTEQAQEQAKKLIENIDGSSRRHLALLETPMSQNVRSFLDACKLANAEALR